MAETVPIEEFGLYLTDLCEKEAMNAEGTLDEVLTKRALELKKRLNTGKKSGGKTPEDTGEYAKGWRVRTKTRNHEKVKEIYNANRPDLTYILEYGNGHQPAQPLIVPALDAEIDQIMDELLSRL